MFLSIEADTQLTSLVILAKHFWYHICVWASCQSSKGQTVSVMVAKSKQDDSNWLHHVPIKGFTIPSWQTFLDDASCVSAYYDVTRYTKTNEWIFRRSDRIASTEDPPRIVKSRLIEHFMTYNSPSNRVHFKWLIFSSSTRLFTIITAFDFSFIH